MPEGREEHFLLIQNANTGKTNYAGRGESFTSVREMWAGFDETEQRQEQLVTPIRRYFDKTRKLIIDCYHSVRFKVSEGDEYPENKGGVGCARIFPDKRANEFLRELREGRK